MSLREHLPLVTSLEKTVDQWDEMATKQKLGALAALIVTTSRPILRAVEESRRDGAEDAVSAHLLRGLALDMSDKVDGVLARATGGVTPLGKELDPLMDKIDFMIQEISLYRRNALPLGHVVVRFSRDLLVTGTRSHVSALTHGEANIGAQPIGQASTLTRLISDRVSNLPIMHRHPVVQTTHQMTATGFVVVSGAVNMKNLLDIRSEYLQTHYPATRMVSHESASHEGAYDDGECLF